MGPINVLSLMATSVLVSSWVLATNPAQNLSLLGNTAASGITAQVSDRAYSFTMTLPNQTGKRFTKLSFSFVKQPPTQEPEPIRFDLSQTQARLGTPTSTGSAIAIDSVWIDETGNLWIEFKSPLPPKTLLTISLKPQTTRSGSTYEYGIAAYPEARSPVPILVGNGILRVN